MEPTLVRRVFAGVVLVCLVLGAGVWGWWRTVSQQTKRVDLPAEGGILAVGGPEAPAVESRTPAAGAPPLATAQRRTATAAPSRSGSVSRAVPTHKVAAKETLYRIAKAYGVNVEAIKQANGLTSDLIVEGQLLKIPGGIAPAGGESVGSAYVWPVAAPVSSYFGPRWGRMHKGIDLAANQGDAIRASQAGEVLLAGEVPGYGQTVILTHADGSRTLYGHSSKLLVKPGQQVKQGQVIALVGSTGNSTGPHLHFEIIVNEQPINPLVRLPQR